MKRRARPGSWYTCYALGWIAGRPGVDSRGMGHFTADDTWVTTTPAYDRWWLAREGMRPPKGL